MKRGDIRDSCSIKIKILKNKNNLKEMDEDYKRKKSEIDEDYKRNRINKSDKFLCSMCLNPKTTDNFHIKNNINCPICQNDCKFCDKKNKIRSIPLIEDSIDAEAKHTPKIKTQELSEKKDRVVIKTKTKSVQTVESESNKSLTLLNEVLTVFQSKKTERFITKDVKDACVTTVKLNRKLSQSKTFQISIDHNTKYENGKYLITSSKTEENRSKIDLIKHKSNSIPQMKIEELKHSLKEKAKSKDVIEEVHRMFATVNKERRTDDINRPALRSGPRILPVVKNMLNQDEHMRTNTLYTCKYCNVSSCMSSGDSVKCHHPEEKTQCCRKEEVDRGVYKCYCTKCRGKLVGFDVWCALNENE